MLDIQFASLIVASVVAALFGLFLVVTLANYGALWFVAYISGADVTVMSLFGMSLRRVKPNMIVNAKIMGRQAGLNIDRQRRLPSGFLSPHSLRGCRDSLGTG